MRSMRKMGSIVGLVAALGVLAGAASASAGTASIRPAGTAFTGVSSGEHVFSISSSIKVRCNQAKFTGTTPNPYTDSTTFTATYGTATGLSGAWCRLYVSGIFSAATVAPSAAWTMQAANFVVGTGASTGTVTTSGATTITVGTCVITVPSATTVVTAAQNDTVQATPPPPGVEVTAAGTGLSYTSTGCGSFGISSGSNATYSGIVDIPELYVWQP